MRAKFLVIFTLLFSLNYTQEVITISYSNDSLFSKISREILSKAYRNIGQKVEFKLLPPERSLYTSNEGIYDGEVSRIIGLEKEYNNLVRIPVTINFFELRIFSKKYNFYIDSLEKLKGYRIGIDRGIKLFEKYTKDLKVDYSDNSLQKFEKLNFGRIDFLIATDIDGIERIKNDLNYSDIKMLDPALERVETFHYLHKKHKNLIKNIEKELKRLEENSEILEIRKKVLTN